MTDLMSRKANYALVIQDAKALEFHASRFMSGSRDSLAARCYQYVKQEASKAEKSK